MTKEDAKVAPMRSVWLVLDENGRTDRVFSTREAAERCLLSMGYERESAAASYVPLYKAKSGAWRSLREKLVMQ